MQISIQADVNPLALQLINAMVTAFISNREACTTLTGAAFTCNTVLWLARSKKQGSDVSQW